ncbi:GRIP domain-containing protein [Ditylenchus destructor]|nr:GRIP domain-containing protein [Ditylenchus destructor]
MDQDDHNHSPLVKEMLLPAKMRRQHRIHIIQRQRRIIEVLNVLIPMMGGVIGGWRMLRIKQGLVLYSICVLIQTLCRRHFVDNHQCKLLISEVLHNFNIDNFTSYVVFWFISYEMGSKEELLRTIEEQKGQIATYETKLKNVVRAYKSIETEKKALEVALTALAPDHNQPAASTSAESHSGVDECAKSEPAPDQIESLKQAISTLTVENKKKEMAFQSDRRSLIQKNEKLQEEVNKLKAISGSQTVRSMKKQLAELEADREKIMSEHGALVSEVQQRYTKERIHSEKIEKQVTEMSRRLQEKDELLQSMESRIKEVGRMEYEIQALRKKAEATPTAQVLREELSNLKALYEDELSTIQNRHAVSSSLLSEKDTRISSLENRTKQLTEQNVTSEQQKAELQNTIEDLRRQLHFVSANYEKFKKSVLPSTVIQKEPNEHCADVVELTSKIKNTYLQLKTLSPSINFYDVLELEKPTQKLAEPRSAQLTSEELTVSESLSRPPSSNDTTFCTSCESSQKEVTYFKSLINHLQRKLDNLEASHDSSKRSHTEASEVLRQRIHELESSQEKIYSQMAAECRNKVSELEAELQRQQQRMMDIAAEKDQELEITKNSLAALYAKGYSDFSLDPLDPPQNTCKKVEWKKRMTDASESFEGATPDVGHHLATSAKRTSGQFEAKNIFYEQELVKREQEIQELKNMVRLSEIKVRDIEQSTLSKDMQYLQIIETLKEEIRVLEGRLNLERSETNMAYLRNIFIQFVNSNSSTGRKHILKAIAAVLRLTPIEMKRIDGWNL